MASGGAALGATISAPAAVGAGDGSAGSRVLGKRALTLGGIRLERHLARGGPAVLPPFPPQALDPGFYGTMCALAAAGGRLYGDREGIEGLLTRRLPPEASLCHQALVQPAPGYSEEAAAAGDVLQPQLAPAAAAPPSDIRDVVCVPVTDRRAGRMLVLDEGAGAMVSPASPLEGTGWRGCHGENVLPSTLFFLLFWDVIFDATGDSFGGAGEAAGGAGSAATASGGATAAQREYLRAVWKHPFQAAPADFGSDEFCRVRAPAFRRREAQLAAMSGCQAAAEVARAYDAHYGAVAPRLRWDLFSRERLCELAHAAGGYALKVLLEPLAVDYSRNFAGYPDLLMWRPLPCPDCELGYAWPPHMRAGCAGAGTGGQPLTVVVDDHPDAGFQLYHHAEPAAGSSSGAAAPASAAAASGAGPRVRFTPAARAAVARVRSLQMGTPGANPHLVLLEVKSHRDRLQVHQLARFARLVDKVPCGIVKVEPAPGTGGRGGALSTEALRHKHHHQDTSGRAEAVAAAAADAGAGAAEAVERAPKRARMH
jgi:hypothetical protein